MAGVKGQIQDGSGVKRAKIQEGGWFKRGWWVLKGNTKYYSIGVTAMWGGYLHVRHPSRIY